MADPVSTLNEVEEFFDIWPVFEVGNTMEKFANFSRLHDLYDSVFAKRTVLVEGGCVV